MVVVYSLPYKLAPLVADSAVEVDAGLAASTRRQQSRVVEGVRVAVVEERATLGEDGWDEAHRKGEDSACVHVVDDVRSLYLNIAKVS